MARLKVRAFKAADEKNIPMLADSTDIIARIREQAYKHFARRSFDPDHALDDWLAAERQVLLPTAELHELADGYLLRIALPGFEADDIHVSATPNALFVRASVESATSAKSNSSLTLWSEFYAGTVYRRTALPREVDADKTTASLKGGILVVDAPYPKAAKATAKKKTKKKDKKEGGKKNSAAKPDASKAAKPAKKKSKGKSGKKTAAKRDKG